MLMSIRKFAKHIGVSHSWINKLVTTGVIPLYDRKIDLDEGIRLMAENEYNRDFDRKKKEKVLDTSKSEIYYVEKLTKKETLQEKICKKIMRIPDELLESGEIIGYIDDITITINDKEIEKHFFLSQKEVYDMLVGEFKFNYETIKEDILSCKIDVSRCANIYAVKNTVKVWKEQFE